MSERIDVMISSTVGDLSAHRKAAMDACMGFGLYPVMMEHLPALDADAIDASLKMVDNAKVYLGIFAHRYGYIPNDSTKNPHGLSMTELEYLRAIEKGKPRLLFVVSDDHTPDLPYEDKAPEKLNDFKNRLTTDRVVDFFHSADDLRGRITQALAHWLELRLMWQPPIPLSPNVIPNHIANPLPPGSRLQWSRNQIFVGREDDLKTLWAVLRTDDKNPTTNESSGAGITAVTGAGGMGKTQLAVEFVYRYGRYYNGVHWLNALTDIGGEIVECGRKMGIRDFDELKFPDQLRLTLDTWHKSPPRLLIFDNLEEPDLLKEWLSQLLGQHILITSRRGQWPIHWGVMTNNLDELTPSESRALLRQLAPHLSGAPDIELDEIGKKLGYLPLALDIVGNYIAFRRLAPAEYLTQLERQKSLVDNRLFTTWAQEVKIISPPDHDLNLYANFDLSWQRLTSEAAKWLLIGCGYLAPNMPIPLELLAALFEGDNDPNETVDVGLLHLDNVGLLSRKEDALPSIHPLIADFARLQTPEGTYALAALAHRMVTLAHNALDTGLPANFASLRSHIERLALFAESAGYTSAGTLLNSLANYLIDIADYMGAKDILAQMLKTLPENDPNYGTVLSHFAVALQGIGDMVGAQLALERALRLDEELYGPTNRKVAIRLNALSDLLRTTGDYRGAKKYAERAIEICEQELGRESLEFATVLNNLALILLGMKDASGARMILEKSLAITVKLRGSNHPDVGTTLWNISKVLYELGKYADAKIYAEKSLQILRNYFSYEHPDIQTIQKSLNVVNFILSASE